MSKPKKEFRETWVTVTGRSPFPLDMLRYDSCTPGSSSDASAIEYSLDGRNRRDANGFPVDFVVNLRRFSGEGTKATAARWASFGWTVTDDTGEDR